MVVVVVVWEIRSYKWWNRYLSQHSISIRVISFVKIENLIRRLNCSCSWIDTFFPYGTPIIIYKRKWVSELRDRASLEWLCLGDKHVQWCCQCILYARDLIRLGTMCACQSRQTVIIVIIINVADRHLKNEILCGTCLFSFERRDEFFFLSLSGKI